jgi:surface antigen
VVGASATCHGSNAKLTYPSANTEEEPVHAFRGYIAEGVIKPCDSEQLRLNLVHNTYTKKANNQNQPDVLEQPMKLKLLILIVLLSTSLIACTQNPNRDVGIATGAVVGGVLGNQIGKGSGRNWATGLGMIAGAIIGGNIGARMDRQDQLNSQRALETYEDNRASSWTNPNSGNSYTVTPTNTYETANGPCREYTTEAVVGGKPETIYGRACRQSDGSWQASN